MADDSNNIKDGLRALFKYVENPSPIENKQNFEGVIKNVPIENLLPGVNQPRYRFDEFKLKELANSIKEQGIILPLIVKPREQGKYEIIAGERRWHAAKIAGLIEVPVIQRDLSTTEALTIGLIENLQREDLSPIEEATGIHKLLSECNLTHNEVAQTLGFSRSAVTNKVRLLELDNEVKALLHNGKIDMGHARALLGLGNEIQVEIAHLIFKKGLSVRQVEALIKKIKMYRDVKTELVYEKKQIEEWKQKLSNYFHYNVNISINHQGKSKVIVNFDTLEDLDKFVQDVTVSDDIIR